MGTVVNQDHWDNFYMDQQFPYREENIQFKEIFQRYVPAGGDCFEVGCYPGDYLVYLNKYFQLRANGIDLTPFVKDQLIAKLNENGVSIGNIYHGDYLRFETESRYDVVCSFGFIEHFTNFEEVILRHMQLVKPGGLLILTCPNFRFLQYGLHFLFDRRNLKLHYIPAMNMKLWRNVAEANHFTVLYEGYYRTSRFWMDTPHPAWLVRKLGAGVVRILNSVDRRLNWPNRYLSPFMIGVYLYKTS